ncbi:MULTISPECIES: helix-turn-helix transcriptional regulator [unclassified Sphingorhabdus]|jgi:prophage regulatory protein|uniref:helix-turn-helix transcriptional regulator n=1 Tax=unclassified Sphingorhabdus TaxID=2614947 RepID=UPI0025F45A82|nr:AlpA family phage regulatory protein [Sphingorhabdus sp. EL138]
MEQSVNSGSVRIARPDEVRTRIGVSRAKFADMVAKGQFPKPFTIIPGGRAVGWLGEDVDAWIMQRAKGDEAQ